MQICRSPSRALPPGNNATNAARRTLLKTRNGLGDLGITWAQIAAQSPIVARPAGVSYTWVTDPGTGAARQVQVPATVMTTDPGTGASRVVINPDFVPPNFYVEGSAKLLGVLPKWSFAGVSNAATFFAAKPTNGSFMTTPLRQNEVGQMIGGVNYYSSPQFEADLGAWNVYGLAAGFIKPNKPDWISKTIELVVEGIVLAGIGYGLYAAAGAALASGGSGTSAGAASAAASDAGTLYAPVAASSAPGALSVATTATVGTSATSAAGLLKAAAGYLGQAKDIYGVANTVRALTSRRSASTPQPSLDTSYGYGSGGGEGGSGGGTSFLTGKNLLMIGGGAFAILAALVILTGKKRGRSRS